MSCCFFGLPRCLEVGNITQDRDQSLVFQWMSLSEESQDSRLSFLEKVVDLFFPRFCGLLVIFFFFCFSGEVFFFCLTKGAFSFFFCLGLSSKSRLKFMRGG